MDSLFDGDTDDETCAKEAEEADEIQGKISFKLICIDELLEEIANDDNSSVASSRLHTSEPKPNDENGSIAPSELQRSESKESVPESVASGCSSHCSIVSPPQNTARIKLPKLEIKKFNGKLQEWSEFWDSYNSAIHSEQGLAKIDKFKYLRGFLEEPVRRVISGLALTEENYDAAVNILTDRYAKPMKIKRVHINDIMNLPAVFNERNSVRLRHLYDDIEVHFRSLEALGADKDSYSSVVVPVVMEKIPEPIRISMIRDGGDYLDWNLQDLLKALAKEVEIREINVPMQQQQQQRFEKRPTSSRHSEKVGTASALFAGKQTDRKKNCQFCQEDHYAEECTKYDSPEERKHILSKYARCFLCLNKGHRSFDCRSKNRCKFCKGKHHFLVCCNSKPTGHICETKDAPQASIARATPVNPSATSWVGSTGSFSSPSNESGVALQTALARVRDKRESKVRVLYDSGSQKTFISAKAVTKLALKPLREESLGIKTFGQSEPEIRKRNVYELTLEPLKNNGKFVTVKTFLVDEICTISNIHVEEVRRNYEHLHNIYFSDISRSEDLLEIDILVGSNYLWCFQEGDIIRGGQHEPVAIKTVLGWVLSGPVGGKNFDYQSDSCVALAIEPTPLSRHQVQDLNKSVHKLWDLETLGIRDNDDVHQRVIDDITFDGQRYSVGLPWKAGHGPIPLKYGTSLTRLKSQLNKLHANPDVLEQYNSVIIDQLDKGIIEVVPEGDKATKVSYLPHQPVVREQVETTKVRVVYDASCKDRTTKTSLNDCLHVGPALNPLMFDILIRFREHPVVLISDIEKAFLNIEVHSEDRDCLHVANPDIITYRFKRVVFGVNSSPFLLNAVLRHHLEKYREIDPQFVDYLTQSFFVDDFVTSCRDSEEAYCLYEKAKVRMLEGGFKLRKWKTNADELSLKISDRENESPLLNEDNMEIDPAKTNPASESDSTNKVLGLVWDKSADSLLFTFKKVLEHCHNTVPTKRVILSTLATLFDPLGLISPLAVPAKILFQDLCLTKLEWDETIPEDQISRWEEWIQSIRQVKAITTPRSMQKDIKGNIVKTSLHGFGDASGKAYCATIYVVHETSEGIYSTLVCSKTRIAPLKKLYIPRLELMAAKILTTLMETVINALGPHTKIDEVRYWTDSMTVLYWIQNRGEWKVFVQHRVDEILKLTKKHQWGHVLGLENPADLGSRGVTASHLCDSRLWWEGPQWLMEGMDSWPNYVFQNEPSEVKEERKREVVLMTTVEEPILLSQVIDIERFSTLGKLIRVTAYIQRFINNLKKRLAKNEINVGRLSVDEIEKAEMEWVKCAQKGLQDNSDFKKFNDQLGIVNENGILVCKGRLEFSELELSTKNPIILPKDSRLTKLIVMDCHSKVHHCKVNATLAELRTRFWVTKGRQYVNRLLSECIICKKLEGKPFNPPNVAPLPDFRVNEAPPFSKIGIDFAGPLYCKGARGSTTKFYIALFTCCVTRGLHLELVNDLSTSTFLNALRRFASRRGTPSLIVSDNAKTFKSTAKLLNTFFTDSEIADYMEGHRIRWLFNLPRCPWAGGIFERMVRSVKGCLRKVLGNARLTADELYTVLTEIECTLNSRPLTYQYDIGEVLTPSHLILGQRLSPFSFKMSPTVDQLETNAQLSKRFLFLKKKLTHFWNRWKKEYLVNLRECHRMKKSTPNVVEKGEVVLIHEDGAKRLTWKMGIVENLITGKDGEVRGVSIQVMGKGKPFI